MHNQLEWTADTILSERKNSHMENTLREVWTQVFFKHIECCNFQTITVMYLKVYIFGMEMSQRIHFWLQIFLKMMIFLKNGKNHFFGQNFLWQANKNSFEFKMPKFLGNHVKTHD